MSKPSISTKKDKQVPAFLDDTFFEQYPAHLMEDWYDDDKAYQACQKLMSRFPEVEISRMHFAIKYMRYIRWYAKKNVEADEVFHFQAKAAQHYSRGYIQQHMDELVSNAAIAGCPTDDCTSGTFFRGSIKLRAVFYWCNTSIFHNSTML